MLTDLAIENLALFERASLELSDGLCALTGETGAGKSLVVGALELLLGEKPRTGIVRTGAEEARVEGRFLLAPGAIGDELTAALEEVAPAVLEGWRALEAGAEREIVLARAVTPSGRTRAWIDHRPATLAALKRVAGHLIEIHGQNEHQRVFDPAEQARVLDEFGGTRELAARWRDARRAHADARRALDEHEARALARTERLELLRFQSGELAIVVLAPDALEELAKERERLRWADGLARDLAPLSAALAEGGALDELRRASRVLDAWRARVAELATSADGFGAALEQAESAAADLERFLQGVESDPARLEAIEERLFRMEELCRRHKVDRAGLAARANEIQSELAELERGALGVDELARRVESAREALAALAAELTKSRARAATQLAKNVQARLADLGLAAARFTWAAPDGAKPNVEVGALEPAAAEFFLAANPGEPARPLRHVASGGEAARILLALRVALALEQGTPTLVFDEIDAGVGGRLGPKVGEHLRALARTHQVVCVTHLPAIAALADRHHRVTKLVRSGRTRTEVALLAGDARVDEVADMIAGGSAHESARAEARRLLDA